MKHKPLSSLAALAAILALPALGAGPLTHGVVEAQPQSAIRIDFRAVTADGKPVTNLEPSDVTLRIGGRPRTITSLDLVEAASGAPGPEGPATPAFATNASGTDGGRTVVLVVDDDSVEIGREEGLKRTLTRIVEGLAPGDKVGLFSTRRTGGTSLAATTDHAAVQQAIDGFRGHSGAETDQDFQCRTLATLQQLQSIIGNATGQTPTTVAFFSAAMKQPSDEAAKMVTQMSDVAPTLCRLPPRSFEDLTGPLAGSRAHVHVAHVAEGTSRTITDAAFGVESVAGVVGTETLRLTGDGEAVAQRILRESAAYYMATIAPDPSDKGGAAQRLELSATREGVRVLSRPSVTPMRLAGAPTAARSGKTSPRDMIRTADAFRTLPLRAAGYASRNQGDDRMRVIVLFEPDDPTTKLASAMVGLFSTEGKLIAQWSSQDADLASSPSRAVLAVAKGEYRMRVAAVDAKGRSGAVDQQLHADLTTAGPISLSTPLLGPIPTSGGFSPKLLFDASDVGVVTYIEAYAVPAGANVTAMLELARTEDGEALGTTEAQVRPGASDEHRLIVGGFSIDTLEPGDYVVRTVINIDGKPVGRAVATMRKTGA